MLGLSFEKLVVVSMIAVFIIGPDRLPLYAARLASAARALRGRTEDAQRRMRDQLGPGFDDTEWTKLDPRRYDPRRIIREALASDETTEVAPLPRLRMSSNGRLEPVEAPESISARPNSGTPAGPDRRVEATADAVL